ncbi:MAG: type II toxin-antitoxin system VapC family toxin [Bacteroidia bacterium]
MNYLLDTNILLIYGRGTNISDQIEKQYNLFNSQNNLAVSVVTLGELNSLSKQFNYGEKRKQKLEKLVEDVFIIDLNIAKIVDRYGEIDAYSQGKLASKPLQGSARNMGKNDLWIAATASVYDMVLVTTDKDFNHLDKVFLNLEMIDLELYK